MSTRKLRQPTAEPGSEPSGPGRVVFDSRGNPVWEWDTGAGDSTSVLLKQLENEDLALEPTRSFRSIDRAAQPATAPAKGRPIAAGAPAARAAPATARKSTPHARATAPNARAAAPHARQAAAENRRSTKDEPFELDEGKAGKGFDPYNRS